MTQTQLVISYVRRNGSIVPSRMHGRSWRGEFFGSEIDRRCREMRAAKMLLSERWDEDRKFIQFFPSPKLRRMWQNESK